VGALRSDSGAVAAGAPVSPDDPASMGGLMIYRAGEVPGEGLPVAVPAMAAPVAEGDGSVDHKEGEVALTFHGLPDEAALNAILKALESRGMAATFFVPGEAAELRPDLVRRIHEAGHEVGSLGYAQIDMSRVSPMTARALVRRAQRAIAEATGAAPAFFRPPLGRFDQNLTRLVEEEGLRLVLWSNVSVRPVPEMEPQRLAEQLAASLFPRAVLMLPLDRENSRAALVPLLERLVSGGYQSRTLSDVLGQAAGAP
jgi:peptidoglycan/xylan/chitin deacetylase (PgdA/CDA1 family)